MSNNEQGTAECPRLEIGYSFLEILRLMFCNMIIPIRVTCYAGYRGEQEPREIQMGGNTVTVTSIQDRWLSPDHRYFKLAGSDECEYIIRHDENKQIWELVYYRHPDARRKADI